MLDTSKFNVWDIMTVKFNAKSFLDSEVDQIYILSHFMAGHEYIKGHVSYDFCELISGKYKGSTFDARIDIPYEFLDYEETKLELPLIRPLLLVYS